MDLSLNAESNTSAPIDDKEKQILKAKPSKFRPIDAILETPPQNHPIGRGSQQQSRKEDCMQPKIRLERLRLGANGTKSPRGYVCVRDNQNCCRMASTVENCHSGCMEKDGLVEMDGTETLGTALPQNNPSMDDKEKPSGVKRIKTPSSTPNKKKPYRAARADESGIPPSAVSATPEPIHNGTDSRTQPHRGDSPNDTATSNLPTLTRNNTRLDVVHSDDRTLKPAIEQPSSSPTPEGFEEVKMEVKVESKPRVKDDPALDDDVTSEYREESQIVAKTVVAIAKKSDDHQRAGDEDQVLENSFPLPETTGIKDVEGPTPQVGVAVFSLRVSSDAEESHEKQRIETEASTLQTSFKKDDAHTECSKDEVRRRPRKTPSYWRRVTAEEEGTDPVEVKTSVPSCKRRKETIRRFYPTKKAFVQPRIARTYQRKRSTSFHFRIKTSLTRSLSTFFKREVSGRSLAVLRPSRRRWPRKAGKLNTSKRTSVGSTRRLSGNRKGPVTEKKVSTSLKNSASKISRSTDQLMLTNNLTGEQVTDGTDGLDKGKSGFVEVIHEIAGEPFPVASDLSVNPTDIPKGESIHRSMFDNFVEGDVSHRVDECDGGRRGVSSPKTESTPAAELPATDNHHRDNIFERFRSSMQSRGTNECLNLSSRKKDRNDAADHRQVPLDVSSRDKKDLSDSVTDQQQQHHANEIKELLGDYDSDSTECCKYDELDEIYSDNQTTKETTQLGGLLGERTENFYPGFSVFNLPSDSDDNLVVDESMDSTSQAVEAASSAEQRPAVAKDAHANSDDEDRQLKKLRNTAYRTYTRKQKQMMQQRGSGLEGIAAEVRRTAPGSPPPPALIASPAAADKVVHGEEGDQGQESVTLDPKVEELDGKRKGRASKKTKNIKMTMKRRNNGIGKMQKSGPSSRHSLPMERKKGNAATRKKRANVCKEFATRSKTRGRDRSNGPHENSASSSSSIYPEVSENTGDNNETTGNYVDAQPLRGKLRDKKIRNGGCRRRQGRPATKKTLATGGETRPAGRRKASASKSKDDPETKVEPPKMDILSRELGPRFNWLEQKIQAMQRSCSDEGFDSRGPRLSPENPSNSTGGPSKRASNIKYESDDDCRGPGAKRWSGEDQQMRQETHAFSDYAAAKSRSEDGRATTEDPATDSELRLTRSSGHFDDFYDPTLASLPGPRLAHGGRRMSPNLVWTVAAPSVVTTTAMPLGLKLVRSSATNSMSSPAANSLDCSSPSALVAATTPASFVGLNDEEGLTVIAEQSRPLSPSPSASPMYYDRRPSHSLGGNLSMRESHLEMDGARNGMRPFSMTGYNCVVGSPFIPDYSLGCAAVNSDPRSVVVSADPTNVFPGVSEMDPSDCQVPFDLSRSAARSKTPAEMELLNEHMAGSRSSPQHHRLIPLQLITTAHNKPPSEAGSASAASRMNFLEQELNDEGVIMGAATQVGVEAVEPGIGVGETVIDLTADVDPVPSNSQGSPQLLKPYPSQDGNELQVQQDTRSTPVLRSIKYEYVRRLEMYERLSKVSKIKDQEIAILESERKRVKKELDCLKNIFVRATAGLPQESEERAEKAIAIGAEKVAGSPAVVESSWSPAGDSSEGSGKAKEAHRRESTVRLVASRTPPDAHSVKMDLSMYTYLKCQYKQDRLKAEEEFRDAYNPDCGPRTGARDTDPDAKVLATPPAQSSVRSSSRSSSDHIPLYHPSRVTGPYSQGNQPWISMQSGECFNGMDPRKSRTVSTLDAGSSSRQVSTPAESDPELGASRPRSLQKSHVAEAVVMGSPFADFGSSSQTPHHQDLNRQRPQNLSEPPPIQHSRESGVIHRQELDFASQSSRTSSYTAEIERKPVLQQFATDEPVDRTRPSPPATSDAYSSKEQQTRLGFVNLEHDGRLKRQQETFNSTDKMARDDAISVLGSNDNQYEVVDLSKSCPGRSKIASYPVEPSPTAKMAERPSAGDDLEDNIAPLALDLKSDNVSIGIPFAFKSSGMIERVEVLDAPPKRLEGGQQTVDYSQSRRQTMHSRVDEKTSVSRERSVPKNQLSGEAEVHGLRHTTGLPLKASYAQSDAVDKGNTEPVDLKIVAVQGATLGGRDQPSKPDRTTEGMPPHRSGSQRPGSTQGSSEGSEAELKGHSIRNLIPEIVPQQQQQRPRDRMKSFDSQKTVVSEAERTAGQGEGEKPEGTASPKTNGRRTNRRWPKQQKSPQQGFYPDKYGLSSNLQDMSFMVNSISTGVAFYNNGGTGPEPPRPTNDLQAPSVENEQRPTVQTDMLNTLSPTYNARALAQRAGYEHGEKRGPALAPYPTESQTMMHQRPVETGTTFTNPQIPRDASGPQMAPSAVDLDSIRPPHVRDAVVYRVDSESSSATGGAPPPSMQQQRYAAELQQGVAHHRGVGRDDVAHLQIRPAALALPPPPPSFRPSNSPVIGHRDSAFVSLAPQRRDFVNARQPIEQLPHNDPSRQGNPDHYHMRQQPGIGAYPQPAPPLPTPRHGEGQMQQRFYGAMPHPPDSQQPQPVNRNDRIPLPVYQKSGQQPYGQQVRQETLPRDAHPQLATHRLVAHQMDLVPSSDSGRGVYGAMMLNSRAGLDLQRGEAGVMPPLRPEDGLMFPGQSRSDAMTISRIVMQQAQRSQASGAGFQETGAAIRGSGPDQIGFVPHSASGIDQTRIGGWRVSQEYAVVREGGPENQQQQLQEASRKTSARHATEQRAMGHVVDQRTSLGVVPVSEQMNSSRGEPSQQRSQQPLHPSQLVGDRYLPSYMESIAGAPQPQQATSYRISGLMNPPVPPGCHPSRQPGKDDGHRPPAPQRHTEQPPTAMNMRGDAGLHLFQTRQPIFPVPAGIVNPAFGGAGHSNPTQVERIHLRPGYDLQKTQDTFGPAAYPPYERPVQLLGGRGVGLSGLAVQPTNMTSSGRQQRQEDLQAHQPKANQAPVHRGLEGYKQPSAQSQQQQDQRGQAAKPVDYICEVCRKPAMFVCSACKGVAYCSTECQAISWQTRHSFMCRQP